MKANFLSGLILVMMVIASIDAHGQKEVLMSEEIENAGIARISDLLFLLNDIHFSTIDGYSWKASINGLAPMQHQNWVLMLNERQINSSFSGIKDLNMLPIAIADIDSVIVFTTPDIYHGHFTENGLIQIVTKKAETGFTFGGSFYAGNETGDPGPYKYTDHYSPNVDRIGKGGAISAGYGSRNFFVRSNFILEEHILTDFAMRRRIHSVTTDGWGSFDRYAPAIEFGFNTARTRHHFYTNYSRAPHYFIFFEQSGREIPTDYSILQSGYSGGCQLNSGRQLSFDAHFSSNCSEESNNIYNIDFDIDLRKIYSRIEYQQTGAKYDWRIGSSHEQTYFRTGYTLTDNSVNLGSVYNSLLYRPNQSISYRFSLMTLFNESEFATKAAISGQWAIPKNHVIQASLSFSRRLFEEENSLWYWIKNGYPLLDDQWINYSLMSDFRHSTHLTADVRWNWKFSPDFTLTTSAYYRKFTDILLQQQSYIYFTYYCAMRASTDIFPDQAGQIRGLSISLEHQTGGMLGQQFHYHYQHLLSGSKLFRRVQHTMPSHEATYRLILFPVKNLSFWIMVKYISQTHWRDYDSMDGASCSRYSPIEVVYHSTVDPVFTLDFQIKKWFWRRQMSASLTGRNLLNNEVSYHPVGASYDLSFYVHLAYHFNF